jgi:hypothetical protein
MVTAFPRNAQGKALTLQPSSTETEHPPNMVSSHIPLPDPRTCQNLLHTVPSLALRVALEEAGCPTEAHNLQLQLTRVGGKNIAETLIHESQKYNEDKGTDNTEVILSDLPGDLKRFQRSVTLPEACTSEHGSLLHEMATLMVEFAEKLPSTDLITEFKTSAVKVTQTCTDESWEQLEDVGKRLMKSPEMKNATIPIEDQIYFIVRIAVVLKRVLLELLQKIYSGLFYFG